MSASSCRTYFLVCVLAVATGFAADPAAPGRGSREDDDHDSPDGRWRLAFVEDGGEVVRVTVAEKSSTREPQILAGGDGDSFPMPTWAVWNADSDLLAIRLGDGPRSTRTVVFRRADPGWEPVELPDFFAEERAKFEADGFVERDHLVDAVGWLDARTLVVEVFCIYSKNDEGNGLHKRVDVRVDPDGTPSIVGTADAPPAE